MILRYCRDDFAVYNNTCYCTRFEKHKQLMHNKNFEQNTFKSKHSYYDIIVNIHNLDFLKVGSHHCIIITIIII